MAVAGPEGGVDVGFLFEPAAEVDAVGFEGAPVEIGVGEGDAESSEEPVHVYVDETIAATRSPGTL